MMMTGCLAGCGDSSSVSQTEPTFVTTPATGQTTAAAGAATQTAQTVAASVASPHPSAAVSAGKSGTTTRKATAARTQQRPSATVVAATKETDSTASVTAGTTTSAATKAKEDPMTITCSGISGNVLAGAHMGKGGTSPAITVANAPKGTACYAVILIDRTKSVSNLIRCNWLIANIPASASIGDGYSQAVKGDAAILQGVNLYGTNGYGGPDGRGECELTVYALSEPLALSGAAGSWTYTKFEDDIHYKQLAKATITFTYAGK